MIPSTPSSTALATSVASARVGRGVLTMVSTTRVKITGLPTRLQACKYTDISGTMLRQTDTSLTMLRQKYTSRMMLRLKDNSGTMLRHVQRHFRDDVEAIVCGPAQASMVHVQTGKIRPCSEGHVHGLPCSNMPKYVRTFRRRQGKGCPSNQCTHQIKVRSCTGKLMSISDGRI